MRSEYDFRGWHITVETNKIGWHGDDWGPEVMAKKGRDEFEIDQYGINGYDGQEHPGRLPLCVLRRMLREWTRLKKLTGVQDREEDV